jgi:hypothetical protein
MIYIYYCLLFILRSESRVEIGSLHGAQTGLELVILLPQPPKCWGYRYATMPFCCVWLAVTILLLLTGFIMITIN